MVSVGKMLALQVRGPELRSQARTQDGSGGRTVLTQDTARGSQAG